MNSKKTIIITIFILIFSLFITGCGKKDAAEPVEETPEITETAVPTPEPTPEPTEEPAALYNQLTGIEQETDTSADRPYAVMINNIIYAQPQVGIGSADWIYEIEAEGGITRMMALFSDISNVPSVGSIRSLRPYYLSIAMTYDAIMLHGGGSPDAYKDLKSYDYDHLDGVKDGTAMSVMFYRDPSRGTYGSEHTLFLKGDQVQTMVDRYEFRKTHEEGFSNGLRFSQDAAAVCTDDAASVRVSFNSSKTMSFTYHPETGVYTGVQYSSPYADGATGEEVPFSNVLVISAESHVYADKGRIEVAIVGSGTGYFCTGGKYVPITWSRPTVEDPFTYTTQDGTPISFTPGKTYCAVIDTEHGGVQFS